MSKFQKLYTHVGAFFAGVNHKEIFKWAQEQYEENKDIIEPLKNEIQEYIKEQSQQRKVKNTKENSTNQSPTEVKVNNENDTDQHQVDPVGKDAKDTP